jgi:flagellar hook-length control protein FliK
MVNSTNTSQAQFSQQVQHLSEIREIANQVLEQIKLVIKPSQTSMEFMLNPEHLGKVALNITSKEGLITATFTTQNQVAKEALESQLQIFKENLNNQGLKVDAIEVNVSNFNFEGSTQMDQSNGNQQEAAKGKKTTLRMDTEDADFLEEALAGLVQDDSADYGNNVDYIA